MMFGVWMFVTLLSTAALVVSLVMYFPREEEKPEETEEVLTLRAERDALRSRLAASERRSEEIIGNLESVIHRLRASRMTYGENNN